jgi:spermidine synthase
MYNQALFENNIFSTLSNALAYAGVVCTRVARWFAFKPKIPIWVNFGVCCYGKSWYIL